MTSSLSTNTVENFGLVPCSNHEHISTADTDAIENSNPVSYLGDETSHVSNEIFFKLIQDPNEPYVDPDAQVKYSRKPRNTHYDKQTELLCRNLWTLSF